MLFVHPNRLKRGMSSIPPLIALCIMGYFYHLFVLQHLVQMIFPHQLWLGFVELVVFHLVFVLSVLSYIQALRTDPGYLKSPSFSSLYIEDPSPSGILETCSKCRSPKPPRVHHCATCQRCVTKFDHHCPWIGNCVGFGNYKFFYLFLVYGTLTCAWMTWRMYMPLRHAILQPLFLHHPIIHPSVGGYIGVSCGSLVLFALAVFHTFLISKGATTLELQVYYGHVNPFSHHLGLWNNWQSVFGKGFSWYWCVPTQVHFHTLPWSSLEHDEHNALLFVSMNV